MCVSRRKEVWVILHNYCPHRSIAAEYECKYRGRLHLVFLPPYSPELNPQENMWAWLKDYCARTWAYRVDKDLRKRITRFRVYAYNIPSKVRRRVDARVRGLRLAREHRFPLARRRMTKPRQPPIGSRSRPRGVVRRLPRSDRMGELDAGSGVQPGDGYI
jgi:hypothetical protein